VRLASLELEGFRNFDHARLELGDGFTVLWGHNGAGKTNILEAIYLLATLRSFRTSDQLERGPTSTRRLARADEKLVRSAADFYGRLAAVLFTPEDLAVLRASPTQRRQFLDRMLFARERAHIVDVQAYERVVRSRNTVLRDESLTPTQQHDLLTAYEQQIAETGARIWTRRERLLAALVPRAELGFAEIHGARGPRPGEAGGQLALSLRYVAAGGELPEAEREAGLIARLAQRRDVDRQRKSTTVGPHRDDVEVLLEGRPVAEFASQGQTRAIILALMLAELERLRERGDASPLLLLDDVSSELDPARSTLLFERLGALAGQCVLTTTSTEFVRLPTAAQCRFVAVAQGAVTS
jgi:DNA replication and repair protein RecF